jgi:PAT family beta-lactamase induction signal transducer AmpG
MLSELGFSAHDISIVLLGTAPYGMKFIFSPITMLLVSFLRRKTKYDPRKIILLSSKIVIMATIGALGTFTGESSIICIVTDVFIMTFAMAVNDIIGDDVRLKSFIGKETGFATSVVASGFRVGMLLSGAGALYLSNLFGWRYAFFIMSLSILVSFSSTLLLPLEKNVNDSESDSLSFKNSWIECYERIKSVSKKYGILAIILLVFSFKFADSCINSLKPVFLQSKAVTKVEYASVSQVIGTFAMILGGSIAGFLSSRMKMVDCVKISMAVQAGSAVCFVILSMYDASLLAMGFYMNISTLFFGFAGVIYRTYISRVSANNVNSYTALVSIGSSSRILFSYFGGIISSKFSWTSLYLLCLVSIIPGLLICRLRSKFEGTDCA